MPSEKTNTLARAVRKDRHSGVQPNTDADAPSCRQKRQTCWRVQRIADAYMPSRRQKRQIHWPATNYGCCCAIAPSEKTNTKKQDRKRHTKGGGQNLVTQTMCLYCLMQVSSLSQQTPASVAMCFQEKCCLVPFLQSTDTTEHRMQQRQQNKNKGLQY